MRNIGGVGVQQVSFGTTACTMMWCNFLQWFANFKYWMIKEMFIAKLCLVLCCRRIPWRV